MKILLPAAFAAAGLALLPAPGVFAQTASPSYYFDVENYTLSGGDPVYSVTDDLTFSNLQINETFLGGFTQTISLGSLDTATLFLDSNSFTTGAPLTSAILTGSIEPGPAQTISTETSIGGPVTPLYVSSLFSADLFGTAPAGPALGTFSLISGNNVVSSVNIVAPAAVPEASTTVSLGLLFALGLGALAVTRRRAASAQ